MRSASPLYWVCVIPQVICNPCHPIRAVGTSDLVCLYFLTDFKNNVHGKIAPWLAKTMTGSLFHLKLGIHTFGSFLLRKVRICILNTLSHVLNLDHFVELGSKTRDPPKSVVFFLVHTSLTIFSTLSIKPKSFKVSPSGCLCKNWWEKSIFRYLRGPWRDGALSIDYPVVQNIQRDFLITEIRGNVFSLDIFLFFFKSEK